MNVSCVIILEPAQTAVFSGGGGAPPCGSRPASPGCEAASADADCGAPGGAAAMSSVLVKSLSSVSVFDTSLCTESTVQLTVPSNPPPPPSTAPFTFPNPPPPPSPL